MIESSKQTAVENVITAQRQTIMFYACGGTGVDGLRQYSTDKDLKDTLSQRAIEHHAYFDTSIANLHGVEKSKVFLVEGTNGGGSDRKRNAQVIVDSVVPFLTRFEPKNINVVIMGTSGATGSVAGPSIIEELLKRGETVVASIIVGVETARGCENSYRTFLGLEALAKKYNQSIVFTYTTIDARKDTKEPFLYQLKTMAAISLLSSGRNLRLDSADVENMIKYTNVTNRPGSLALLDVHSLPLGKDIALDENYISTATLLRDDTVRNVFVNSEYGKTGYYMNPSIDSGLLKADGWFFGISSDALNKRVIKNLEELKKNADQQTSIANRVQSLSADVSSDATVEGSTLIL